MADQLNGASNAVCFTLWFKTHTNHRYAQLFNRLDPLVRFYKVPLSRHRFLRGMQYRLWQAFSRRIIYPGVLGYLGRSYQTLLSIDCNQIPAWPRHDSVVVDIDDPVFSPAEITLLNLPQVKKIIVTTEKAKTIFERLGVTRPICVIPQGVSVEQIDIDKVQEIGKRFKGERDVVIGYHAPTLTLSRDGRSRTRGDQDDLDFLFAALEKARGVDPRIKLWLFGQTSETVKQYAAEADWIKLFGYIPFTEILNYIANLDIGVYPRTWTPPPGRSSVKISQFMGCGVPIVSTDVDEAFLIEEIGCGIVCDSQESFVKALIQLVRSPQQRAELGKSGKCYAMANLSWSRLLERYQTEVRG